MRCSSIIYTVPTALRDNLFTADIICHGVPSQKVFDEYIKTLEKKHGGKVSDFSFRVKDNKYKHAHGYSYKVTKDGKTSVVNGIYTNSSFYNAFKNYLIFRNGCYDCQYATLQRVSDITLADFWGIEKYEFKGNVDTGVSMIITNTKKGYGVFASVKENTVSKEFPVQYGIDSNHCLTHSENYIMPLFGALLIVGELIYCIRLPYYYMITNAGHFRQIAKSAYIEAGLNIIISLALVFPLGLTGLAIGAGVAMTYRTVYLIRYCCKNITGLSIVFPVKRIFIFTVTSVIAVIGASFISFTPKGFMQWFIYAAIVGVLVLTLLGCVSLVFYRNDIKTLLQKLKSVVK